jgi:DNA invertase Pin-like site-specific DNA recombinase
MENNKNLTAYQAAVYLRLSREDGDAGDGAKLVSNSISNQKALIMDYLESHTEIEVYSVYADGSVKIGLNQKDPYSRGR